MRPARERTWTPMQGFAANSGSRRQPRTVAGAGYSNQQLYGQPQPPPMLPAPVVVPPGGQIAPQSQMMPTGNAAQRGQTRASSRAEMANQAHESFVQGNIQRSAFQRSKLRQQIVQNNSARAPETAEQRHARVGRMGQALLDVHAQEAGYDPMRQPMQQEQLAGEQFKRHAAEKMLPGQVAMQDAQVAGAGNPGAAAAAKARADMLAEQLRLQGGLMDDQRGLTGQALQAQPKPAAAPAAPRQPSLSGFGQAWTATEGDPVARQRLMDSYLPQSPGGVPHAQPAAPPDAAKMLAPNPAAALQSNARTPAPMNDSFGATFVAPDQEYASRLDNANGYDADPRIGQRMILDGPKANWGQGDTVQGDNSRLIASNETRAAAATTARKKGGMLPGPVAAAPTGPPPMAPAPMRGTTGLPLPAGVTSDDYRGLHHDAPHYIRPNSVNDLSQPSAPPMTPTQQPQPTRPQSGYMGNGPRPTTQPAAPVAPARPTTMPQSGYGGAGPAPATRPTTQPTTQPAPPSQADLEHTARLRGITVEEVKRQLAARGR